MEKHSLIRTIYLYLFTLVGLGLLTIGGVRFVDMGLRAFVFTEYEKEQRLRNQQFQFPSVPYPVEQIGKLQGEEGLTEEQKAVILQWLQDYKNWQEESSKIDYLTAQRHRDASLNLSLIIIGLPLYLYHWSIIKRETKKE